ncbi:hypothetical protein AALP_AA4G007500 [Arabis alpina]|uniref:25S rRNA (uridine-N(3))-methyltransferase BMT5-like domain-containing protein n=1 Tax=Arabis alpina TaxID=50452 RepID=A0A087H0B5_ARAAL|nr:hypothetical protein AALP_AA4G007500 [Arabis alpina]
MNKSFSVRDDDDQVWVTHYSSNHQILLVGEGDFSFSHSLAISFGSASNISASSLDSYDDVVRKYKNARSNLETLKRLGASLYHGVDATKLHFHPDLHFRRFDRIIFNFPHAGFHGKEADPRLIRKHRELVFGFFRSASHMLRADGEIHVSHKNKEPFCQWNLEGLASRCFLVLVHCVAFEKSKYPGYENKRGDGSRCDKPFTLGECSTFKFRLCRVAKELYAEKVKSREMKEQESKRLQAFPNEQNTSLNALASSMEFRMTGNDIGRAFLIRTLENRQKDAICFVKTFQFKLLKNHSSNTLTASMEFLMESITGKYEPAFLIHTSD